MNFHWKLAVTVAGAALMAVLLSGTPAVAQSGKALYVAKGCVACHGPDGKTPIQPIYPKLNGQNAPYLVATLKAYRAQERKGPQAMLMLGMAMQLTDSEMEKIAAYLSQVR